MISDENLRDSMVEVGGDAIGVVRGYFKGKEPDTSKVDRAFKMLNHTTKIMHMNQVRVNTERSHAIRLLKYLPDDEVRKAYIQLTNPTVAQLLESRPKKKKKK